MVVDGAHTAVSPFDEFGFVVPVYRKKKNRVRKKFMNSDMMIEKKREKKRGKEKISRDKLLNYIPRTFGFFIKNIFLFLNV